MTLDWQDQLVAQPCPSPQRCPCPAACPPQGGGHAQRRCWDGWGVAAPQQCAWATCLTFRNLCLSCGGGVPQDGGDPRPHGFVTHMVFCGWVLGWLGAGGGLGGSPGGQDEQTRQVSLGRSGVSEDGWDKSCHPTGCQGPFAAPLLCSIFLSLSTCAGSTQVGSDMCPVPSRSSLALVVT